MTLLPDEIVGGQYRIIKKLGQGTFGATYLAEDLRAFGKQCAVKHFNFVSNDPASFNEAKKLFEREANVLLTLTESRNSHIPHFISYFDENKEFYLVQELIDGHTLRDELQQKNKLQEDEVAELLEDMLEVLKFLYKKKIIHRDIKPENLMRRRNDGKLFLIDFGSVKEVVAKLANSSPQNKPTKIFTTGYAPIEQIQGKPTFNSDIYALGVTALEALTGLEPQKLKDPHTGKVFWPSQLKVSDRLVKILEKMVHEDDLIERYQSADAVLHDVKDFRKTQVVSPGGSPSIQTSPVQIVVPGVTGSSSLISRLNTWFKSLPIWLTFGILVSIVVGIAVPVAFVVTRAIMAPRPIVTPDTSSQEPDTSQPRATPDTSSQKAHTSQPTTSPPPPEDKENGTGNSLPPAVNCGPFRKPGQVCPEGQKNTSP
ncbi:protein kinase [Aerosakkonemataceae cyanobacterium BLCC-F154]|uniref:non-specific serine/threonine protein kinase n=1 Tax=Floridaenema fluviatile BLCC-F154 TaxID=3153640 RepID=A0ABV4YF19_9CYAN